MMKKGVTFVFLALVVAVLVCLINGVSATDISACGNLTSSDTYVLTQNVTSTATCMNISASNVTLDCQGFTINYSSSSQDTEFTSNSY